MVPVDDSIKMLSHYNWWLKLHEALLYFGCIRLEMMNSQSKCVALVAKNINSFLLPITFSQLSPKFSFSIDTWKAEGCTRPLISLWEPAVGHGFVLRTKDMGRQFIFTSFRQREMKMKMKLLFIFFSEKPMF